MKKLFSILLVVACIFGLFACVTGIKDNLNIKDYKTIDGQTAEDGVAAAREGIAQLKENYATYVDGVAQYEAGLVTLEDGRKALAAGQAQYDAGKATLAANTQAYNEGKETLSKIEPLMPLVNAYVQFRDGSVAKLQGFTNAQAWFAQTVRPLAANLGLEIPEDVVDFPAYIQNMVADGKAQLKQYEDGQAQLKAAAGQLADGKKTLAEGEEQLAAADALLAQFEAGEAQLADGFSQLLEGMGASVTRDGKQVVPSLAELLGDGWSLDKSVYVQENGKVVECRGNKLLDLDACVAFCDECDHYLDLSGADTTEEIVGRILLCGLMGIASVFGIIAGIIALVGNKSGFGAGLVSAICAIGGNIAGIIIRYGNLTYMPKFNVDGVDTYKYVGDTQMIAVIVLAVIAVLFVIFAGKAKKSAAKEAAVPAVGDKLAELEKENESLKEMVAKLAEEATVKE